MERNLGLLLATCPIYGHCTVDLYCAGCLLRHNSHLYEIRAHRLLLEIVLVKEKQQTSFNPKTFLSFRSS